MSLSKEEQIVYIDQTILFCFMGLVFILPIAHTMAIRSFCMFLPAGLWLYKMWLTRETIFISNQMTLPIALFAVAATLSLFTAVDPSYTLRELRGEMATCFLLFFVLLNNIRDMEQVNKIVLSLLVGNFIHCAYGIIHYFSINGSLLDHNIKVGGLTAGYISFSVFLITVIPFITYKIMTSVRKNRFFFTLLLVLNLFMVYTTHQRGAWIALFVQAIIFFWFVKRRMIFLVCGAAVLAILLMPKNLLYHGNGVIDLNAEEVVNPTNTINSRITLWKSTIKEIAAHPFVGIGFGRHSFSTKYERFRGTDLWHALNTFLNIAIQLGVQGLLALLFIIYRLIRTFLTGLKETEGEAYQLFLASLMCIVGFFIRNMFDDHYVDDNAQMFWVLMGISVAVFLQINKLVYHKTSQPE